MKKPLFLIFGLCIWLTFSQTSLSQNNIIGKLSEHQKSETVKKAYKKLDAGDVAGALNILDNSIAKKVDLLESYRIRSFIRQFYKNDIDGAILDLTKAIELKPDDENLYIARANLRKKYKNDYESALTDYRIAQKYNPNSINLFGSIANLKAELKDFEGAIAEIQSASKALPANIEINLILTDLFVEHNQSDKAIFSLQSFLDNFVKNADGKLPKVRGEKVKKKIPNELQIPSSLASTMPVSRYSQMDFSINSWADLEKQFDAIEQARSLSRAFIILGKLYTAKNDFDNAIRNLNTAIEIDKNQEEAYGLRGVIYFSRDEFNKAIIEFSEAINIADIPYFYLNRGIAFLAINNSKKAEADFDSFLKLYPNGQTVLDERIAEIKQRMKENSISPK